MGLAVEGFSNVGKDLFSNQLGADGRGTRVK